MYELLALRPPFDGRDRASLIGQITSDAPPPLRTRVADVPRDLEEDYPQGHAPEPAARYASAADLAEDLHRYLENRPIKARRSLGRRALGRWCGNPVVASLSIAVFVLLVCFAVGSTVAAFWLQEERDAALLATMGWENRVRLWNWRTGQQVLSNPGHWTCSLHFSPQGHMLIRQDVRHKLIQVTAGAEYRSLVRQSNTGAHVGFGPSAVHPNRHMLIVPMEDALCLWDLQTGDEAALVPIPTGCDLSFLASHGVLTNGSNGLLFWPVRLQAASAGQWRLGPPQYWKTGVGCTSQAARTGR